MAASGRTRANRPSRSRRSKSGSRRRGGIERERSSSASYATSETSKDLTYETTNDDDADADDRSFESFEALQLMSKSTAELEELYEEFSFGTRSKGGDATTVTSDTSATTPASAAPSNPSWNESMESISLNPYSTQRSCQSGGSLSAGEAKPSLESFLMRESSQQSRPKPKHVEEYKDPELRMEPSLSTADEPSLDTYGLSTMDEPSLVTADLSLEEYATAEEEEDDDDEEEEEPSFDGPSLDEPSLDVPSLDEPSLNGPSEPTTPQEAEDDDNEEEEEDLELAQYTSDAESSMPTIPSTLLASPSNQGLKDYTPKCDTSVRHNRHDSGEVTISTRIDVDDAVQRYNDMLQLLGGQEDEKVPIITCNVSTDSRRTVGPVDLEELKGVLGEESKAEIMMLYDAIMREQGGGRTPEVRRDATGQYVAKDSVQRSSATSRRKGGAGAGKSNKSDLVSRVGVQSTATDDKVECLLECYASIAGGSTLPSTLEGSTASTGGKSPELTTLDKGPAANDAEEAEETKETAGQQETGVMAKKSSFVNRKLLLSSKRKKSAAGNSEKASEANVKTSGGSGGGKGGRPNAFKQLFSKKKRHAAKKHPPPSRLKEKKKKKKKRAISAASPAMRQPRVATPASLVLKSGSTGEGCIASGLVVSSNESGVEASIASSLLAGGSDDGPAAPEASVAVEPAAPSPSVATLSVTSPSVAAPSVATSITPSVASRISLRSLTQLVQPLIKKGASTIQESLDSVQAEIKKGSDSIQESLASAQESLASAQESLASTLKNNALNAPLLPPPQVGTGAENEASDNLPHIGTALTANSGARSTSAKGIEVVRDAGRGKDKIMVSRPAKGKKKSSKGRSKRRSKSARSKGGDDASPTKSTAAKSGAGDVSASLPTGRNDGPSIPPKSDNAEDGLFEGSNKCSSKKSVILEDGATVPKEAMRAKYKTRKKLFEEEEEGPKASRAISIGRGRSMGRGGGLPGRRSRSVGRKKRNNSKEEEVTGGLWEDDGPRSSKSSKVILEDGALVPDEACRPKSLAKSIRNVTRSRSRSRTRSFSIGRRKADKNKDAKNENEDEEEDEGGDLWDDGSRRGKSSKEILEDGALVPELKPKSLARSIKNMSRSRSRSLSRLRRSKRDKSRIVDESQINETEEENEGGGLWEDGSPRSKFGKEILKEGALVPDEAFKPKPVSERVRNMMNGASRVRSLSPLRRPEKDEGKVEESEEETGGLWEDGYQKNKSGKKLLEDGALVPEEAFKPKPLSQRIQKMKKNMRSRSLVRSRTPRVRKEGTEPVENEKVKKSSDRRFKSPVRLRSPLRRRDVDDERMRMEGLEIADKEKKPDPPALEKRRSLQRFRSPLRFRSPIRRGQGKSRRPMEEADSSGVESGTSSSSSSDGSDAASESSSSGDAATSADEAKSRTSGAASFKSKTSLKSRTSFKKKSDGSIMSGNTNKSARSKRSVVSWSNPVYVAKSKTLGSESRSSKGSIDSKKRRILRGFRDGEDVSDSDVSFVERELLKFSGQLVSKGVKDWFNWNKDSKSYESLQVDAREDKEEAAEERGGNWFNWTAAKDEDDEAAEKEDEGEDGDDASRESADEDPAPGENANKWFNWNAADDGPRTDGIGGGDAAADSSEEGETSRDDDDAAVRDREPAAAAEHRSDDGGDGWLSPLTNYFVNPRLGDIGLTDAEMTEEEGKDDEGRGERRRTSGGGKSRKGRRSKSGSRSSGSGTRRHRPRGAGRSKKSSGRDSPIMDNVLLIL